VLGLLRHSWKSQPAGGLQRHILHGVRGKDGRNGLVDMLQGTYSQGVGRDTVHGTRPVVLRRRNLSERRTMTTVSSRRLPLPALASHPCFEKYLRCSGCAGQIHIYVLIWRSCGNGLCIGRWSPSMLRIDAAKMSVQSRCFCRSKLQAGYTRVSYSTPLSFERSLGPS
jgi:hypothetical protein